MLLELFTKILFQSSVEDLLSPYRTGWNETSLVSESSYINNDENVIIAPGQGKISASILIDEFCEEQLLPYLLPKGKFGCEAPGHFSIGCEAPGHFSISPARYFNQRLLNFNQHFALEANYMFLPGLHMSSTTYVHQ